MFKKIKDYISPPVTSVKLNFENKYKHSIHDIRDKLYYSKKNDIYALDEFFKEIPYASNMLFEVSIALFTSKKTYNIIKVYGDYDRSNTKLKDIFAARNLTLGCGVVFDRELEKKYRYLIGEDYKNLE